MESTFDASEVYEKLNRLKTRLPKALDAMAEVGSQKMEAYAKPHAPWTDRTGQARQRLRGYVEQYDTGVRITLAHGVDYGEYLEFAHEKRNAIIKPTLSKNEQKVVKSWQRMVSKI